MFKVISFLITFWSQADIQRRLRHEKLDKNKFDWPESFSLHTYEVYVSNVKEIHTFFKSLSIVLAKFGCQENYFLTKK